MPDPRLRQYQQEYPVPCENFETDANLSNAEKERFLIHIDAFKRGDFEYHINEFFRAEENKKLGLPIAAEPNEVFGSVRALSSFASRFTTANGLDHDPSNAEEYVRDLTYLPAGALRITLQTVFTPNAQIARYLMWSYRNPPHYDDPFLNVDLDDLVCRLALPGNSTTEWVGFGHESPADPRLPTAFDAGLFDEWRPGGRTNPLPACSHKYAQGLPEVVHDSNVFHNIVTNLRSVS